MGCDGGSIPRRDEMVKLKKKAEKADPEIELSAKWKHCALSGEKLKKPIVACDLGKLYNKESLLLALLDKHNLPEVAQHIRSLKDIIQLSLTPNPAYKPAAVAMAEATQAAEFVCPVSGLEMNGRHRFVFLRGCGCVLSERALKEVPSQNCHKCGQACSKSDVVILNGTESEVKQQRQAMEERRLEMKQAKLAKRKRKNVSPMEQSSSSGSGGSSSEERDSPPVEKKQKCSNGEDSTSGSGLTNGSLISEPEEKPKCSEQNGDMLARKNGSAKKPVAPKGVSKYSRQQNNMAESTSTSKKVGMGSTASSVVKKATSELESSFKSPATDPNARDAYKSLFHSADKERPKEKQSHWVTFFPYH